MYLKSRIDSFVASGCRDDMEIQCFAYAGAPVVDEANRAALKIVSRRGSLKMILSAD